MHASYDHPRVLHIPSGDRPLMHIYGIIIKKDDYGDGEAQYARAVERMTRAYTEWRQTYGELSDEWKFAVNVGDDAAHIWRIICEQMPPALLGEVVLWQHTS